VEVKGWVNTDPVIETGSSAIFDLTYKVPPPQILNVIFPP